MDSFTEYTLDRPIVKKFKIEANLVLDSITDLNEKHLLYQQYKQVAAFIEIFTADISNLNNFYKILEIFKNFMDSKILFPINLSEENFVAKGGMRGHIRYSHMYMDHLGIFDNNLFKCEIKRIYDNATNNEIINSNDLYIFNNKPIYLLSGGVTNGYLFNNAYIPNDKKYIPYMPSTPIIFKVIKIIDDNNIIFCIDNKDQNYKILCKEFVVPITFNKEMKGKYDTRKYQKLYPNN